MITKKIALTIIMWLSFAGILFSGYMSYKEIFGNICNLYVCSTIANMPVCVYGFIMFVTLFIVSIVGLRAKR
ncbi:MAG: hypothetical protein N3D20_00970 [Candidatus Pacearchaeota archaeon]|nr:hypothetical protein [Candidatus Pacearchaeota archaeon]